MFLLNWYKEYLEIKAERDARKKELNFCESCDTLKIQLAIANDERKMLINKITETTKIEEKVVDVTTLKPVMPSRMNWNVRRQALEAEDRAAARILRQNVEANKSSEKSGTDKALSVTEIEKELGVSNA